MAFLTYHQYRACISDHADVRADEGLLSDQNQITTIIHNSSSKHIAFNIYQVSKLHKQFLKDNLITNNKTIAHLTEIPGVQRKI